MIKYPPLARPARPILSYAAQREGASAVGSLLFKSQFDSRVKCFRPALVGILIDR